MNFRDLIEDTFSSTSGFSADGEVITVSVEKNKNNSLMSLSIKGNKTISFVKSYTQVENEEKYEELAKKYSKTLELSIEKFEKELNKLIMDFSEEVKDI